jgi:putative ATP-binding cassette transporter
VQAAGAFAAVLSAISVIVENFESLSRFAAGIDRLDTLAGVLAGQPACRPEGQHHPSAEGPTWRWTCDPADAQRRAHAGTKPVDRDPARRGADDRRPERQRQEFAAARHRRPLAIGSGTIYRPPPKDILFLPQQPYMLLGSLRSQLLYPNQDTAVADAQLLRGAGEGQPARSRRAASAAWTWNSTGRKVLSVGEQQRLAFARVLLTRPRFAMLDEATSALDPANEAASTGNCRKRRRRWSASPTAPASSSTTSRCWKLTGNCGWATHAANRYRFSQ